MHSAAAAMPFCWPIRVYYEDTDAQGVVYYANYFRFMERARTEWLRALGVDQTRLRNEQQRIFVVAETQAEFLRPARFNDEIVVTAALEHLGRASFDIEQKIFLGNTDGDLLIRASVKAAYLHADTFRPKRVPAQLFEEPAS